MIRIFYFFLPLLLVFIGHYAAANAYAALCAPLSLKGFIYSLFTTSSPVCNSLLGALNFTSNNYTTIIATMTAVIAGLFTAELVKPRQGSQDANPTPA